MSTEVSGDQDVSAGAAELTALGKRLEILRIERGVSKQRLARHAGTSRQQLWRVMTGKSELTTSLRERLASALAVESATLVAGQHVPTHALSAEISASGTNISATSTATVDEYLGDPQLLAATLRTLPSGGGGRRLKRALLNALEDLAVETGRSLPIDYSEIHRRVLAGEL
ncbi:MAG: helix-turn-helix transcriptional regulator [Gemmatimonadaceae bacterium]